MLSSSQMSIFHKSHDSVATLMPSFLRLFALSHVGSWPLDKWPKAGLANSVAAALAFLWLLPRTLGRELWALESSCTIAWLDPKKTTKIGVIIR
jgi:hypothetical protein